MASEQLLTVSLKEYKKSIDELRASLLGLEAGSEEYAKIADEIKDRQSKLNEVLSVGKKNVDALPDSYNALAQEMAKLRESWKATNDEAERATLGTQINSINDKLKNFDASIGNYQRNVGNYAQGFVDGFSKIQAGAGALGAISPTFAGISSAMGVATAGVHGLTGAFTALNTVTGGILIIIGAVVTALSAAAKGIASNEELSQRWNKALAVFRPILDAVGIALQGIGEVLVTIVEWGGKAFEFIARLIPGYEELANKEKEISDLQKQYDVMEGDVLEKNAELHRQEEEARAKAMDRELYSAEERKKYLEEAHILAKKQIENSLILQQFKLREMRIAESIKANSAEENDELTKQIAKVKELQAALAAEDKQYNRQKQKFSNEEKAEQKARLDAINREAEERKRKAEEVRKKRIEEEKKYAEETKKIMKSVVDAGIAERERLHQAIMTQQQKELQEGAKSMDSLRRGMLAQIGLILTTATQMSEETKKEYENAFDFKPNTSKIENIFKGLLLTTQEFSNEQKAIIEKGISGIELDDTELAKLPTKARGVFEEYNTALADFYANRQRVESENALTTAQTAIEAEKRKLDEAYNLNVLQQERLDKLKQRDAMVANPTADPEMLTLKEQTAAIEEEYNKRLETINAFYANETAKQEAQIAKYQEIADNEQYSAEARLEATKAIEEAQSELRDLGIEKEIQLADAQIQQIDRVTKARQKALDKQIKNITTFSKSTGSLLGAVADAWQADLDAQVKAGKKSDEEAEKEFERIKGLQVAQTIINTLAGGIGAFLQDKATYPAPWSYIIAGADLATTLAAGYAQVRQIEAQEYSSSSSSSAAGSTASAGASVASVGVTPTIDSNTDIMGLTSLAETKDETKETKVYILDSEIYDSQDAIKVRNSETTF